MVRGLLHPLFWWQLKPLAQTQVVNKLMCSDTPFHGVYENPLMRKPLFGFGFMQAPSTQIQTQVTMQDVKGKIATLVLMLYIIHT